MDNQGKTGNVIDQGNAVTVVEQASGGKNRLGIKPVALRKQEILLALGNL